MFAADDADPICRVELLLGRVGECRLHVVRHAAVADEVGDARAEGAAGEVEVPHDVQGQAVVGADEDEESQVDLARVGVRVEW